MILNHSRFPLFASLAASGLVTMLAQLAVPEPPSPNADQPLILNSASPLNSLETQLVWADFDQRGAFATAFDDANRSVDLQFAELRSRGLIFADEATANLATARDEAKQVFRDLSLTTKESWGNARHNAVVSLRKVRDALADLERSAGRPRA